MSTNKVDFGILYYDTEPGLWEKLYNAGLHAWETMDDADVWLNSDDDVLKGRAALYRAGISVRSCA